MFYGHLVFFSSFFYGNKITHYMQIWRPFIYFYDLIDLIGHLIAYGKIREEYFF